MTSIVTGDKINTSKGADKLPEIKKEMIKMSKGEYTKAELAEAIGQEQAEAIVQEQKEIRMFEGEYTAAELVEAIGQKTFDRLRYYTEATDQGIRDNWRHFVSAIDVTDEDGDTYEVRAIYRFSQDEMDQVELLEHLDWDDPEFEVELMY